MKRREIFGKTLAGASAVSALSLINTSAAEAPNKTPREYYELRLYHLRRGAKQKMFDDYLKDAFIPAANRAGVANVGIFNVMTGPDSPTVYALIPYQSWEHLATVREALANDAEYAKAGAEFQGLPATDPGYVRVESSLMVAFAGMAKLEVPEKKSRIFELRTYESHNKKANKKKIEMFNVGEIAIFRRAGLAPVFFGETLIGARLPNLTYMLVYESMAARDKNWSQFIADPEWKKLSTTPGYTDPEIVSNISNVMLRPAGYSQI